MGDFDGDKSWRVQPIYDISLSDTDIGPYKPFWSDFIHDIEWKAASCARLSIKYKYSAREDVELPSYDQALDELVRLCPASAPESEYAAGRQRLTKVYRDQSRIEYQLKKEAGLPTRKMISGCPMAPLPLNRALCKKYWKIEESQRYLEDARRCNRASIDDDNADYA